MSADAVLMALHRKIDADYAPYLRLATARGEACELAVYVAEDAKEPTLTFKSKPGRVKAKDD